MSDQKLAHAHQILPAGDERAGDKVYVVFRAKQDVGLVLLAQVILIEQAAGKAHALQVAQRAADNDAAARFCGVRVLHLKLDQAVVDQHAVAGLQLGAQAGIAHRHALLVADDFFGGQREGRALF